VQFKIVPHSAVAPPPDAIELLWQRLGVQHGDVSFAKAGALVIEARTDSEPPVSMTRDEREQIGRRVVLDVLREVCEDFPELESDWFAVSSDL